MPQSVQCSQCQRKLRVPDELIGRKVKCPSCGNAFTAEAQSTQAVTEEYVPPAPPRPAESAFEFSRPSSYEDDPYSTEEHQEELGKWRRVRTGLTLCLIAFILWICMVGVSFLGGFLQAAAEGGPGRRGDPPPLVFVLQLVNAGLGLTALLLWFGGQIFLAMAPSRHGARGLGLASAITMGLLLLAYAAILLMAVATGAQLLDPGGQNFGEVLVGGLLIGVIGIMLLYIAEPFLFLFFMRATARCIKDRGLATNVGYLIALLVSIIICFVGMFVFMVAAIGADAGFADVGILVGGCGCILLILSLAFVVWMFVTLIMLRNSLSTYIRRLDRYGD